MEIGACPRCTRPYSAGDVVGFGILRPRAESAGGPLVEYTCPGCDHVLRLVPHGEGRFAAPGSPPPPPVPEAERRPPWLDEHAERRPPTEAPRRPAEEPVEPEPAEAEARPEELVDDDEPLDPVQALAILGCAATDDRRAIERAFRERSLTCHPDKVAHLDAEFQALAEKKFKRLQAARDLLLP
jgi:hypothetical protein